MGKPSQTKDKNRTGNSLIRLFSDSGHQIPKATHTNTLINFHSNSQISDPHIENTHATTEHKHLFDIGGSFGGPQFKLHNEIGPLGFIFDVNLGRSEECLFTNPTITRGFETMLEMGKWGIGAKVEKKAEGETRPHEFDQRGRVIIGSSRTEDSVLRKAEWKWQIRCFHKSFGIAETEYAEEDFTIKFDEAFLFIGLKAELNLSEAKRRTLKHLKLMRKLNAGKNKNSTMQCHGL